jgi:hypothetical protein
MNNHLEAVLKEKHAIRQRLLRPMCQENLPLEAVYHRLDQEVEMENYACLFFFKDLFIIC